MRRPRGGTGRCARLLVRLTRPLTRLLRARIAVVRCDACRRGAAAMFFRKLPRPCILDMEKKSTVEDFCPANDALAIGSTCSTAWRLMNDSCVQRMAKTSRSTWMKHEVRGRTPEMPTSAKLPATMGFIAFGVPEGGGCR
eukprot:5103208-Prymnesium_polylepis.2